MSEKERYALAGMVYEAVRFAIWAAGEGICPALGENAVSPEDFLFEYSNAVDIDDWDGLHIVARDALLSDVTRPTRCDCAADETNGLPHRRDCPAFSSQKSG